MKPTFKLSQATKDFFDILRTISSYVSIVSIGLLLVAFYFGNESFIDWAKDSDRAPLKIIALIIGVILIIGPFVFPVIYSWVLVALLKQRKFNGIIIDCEEIQIDIMDNGKVASYFNKVAFSKIGKNSQFISYTTVSGEIEEIKALNCYYSLNSEKKKMTLSYVNNIRKLNNYKSITADKGQEKFLMISAILKNTFTEKIENWDILPYNYCVQYNLEITLPKKAKLIWAKIFTVSESGVESEIDEIVPIVVIHNGRVKLILQVVNYDYGETLRLKWAIY